MEKIRTKSLVGFILGILSVLIIVAERTEDFNVIRDISVFIIPIFLLINIGQHYKNTALSIKLISILIIYVCLLFTPANDLVRLITAPNAGVIIFYLSTIYFLYFRISLLYTSYSIIVGFALVGLLRAVGQADIAEVVAVYTTCQIILLSIRSGTKLAKLE